MSTTRKLLMVLFLFAFEAQADIVWPSFIRDIASNYAKKQISERNLYRNAKSADETSYCYRYLNNSKEYNWLCMYHIEDWLLRADDQFIHIKFTPSSNSKHFCLKNKQTRKLRCYTACVENISRRSPNKCYELNGDIQVVILDILDFKKASRDLKKILHARFGEDYTIRR